MNTMEFWLSINSFMMVLSRSSNWPRYFVPATISERSSDKNALVGQERRHIAIGNALRQAFDDGRFANARLADQHRIILGAAAQNLDDALDFAFASDQRIELTFGSRLRQIAAELRQQRSFFRTRSGSLFPRGARQFFTQAWRAAIRAPSKFPRRSTFLRAKFPAANVRCRRASRPDARLPHRPY